MKRIAALLAALAVLMPASAFAGTEPNGRVEVEPLPAGAKAKPVALTRLKSELRPDQTVGTVLFGVICIQPQRLTWRQAAPQFVNLKDIFGEELLAAGFKPESAPGSLFADREHVATDLEVGALIKGMDASYCEDIAHISGKIRLDIEWQVYSSIQREVLATIDTHETAQRAKLSMTKTGSTRSLVQETFAQNIQPLLADPKFRAIVTSSEPVLKRGSDMASQTPIVLAGATQSPTAISDAVGSVVSVFAGDGFGSGVLVSSDGYILTNHHVVGGLTTVRLRWSDGFEATGTVVRSDRRRDVALIKAESRGRTPLALNRAIPSIGTPVFAIGTPLDPTLQSTVTRGIVSANRIVDGFSFIQSDTPVTHGNSGGPLIDETGAVRGLTDWGVPAEKGSSLNFFIPIGDALDFLQLKAADNTPLPQTAIASKPPAKP